MPDLAGFMAALELTPVGEGRYRGANMDNPGPVVFGGQMLAHVVAAASLTVPEQAVKSLHTVFSRGATADLDLDIEAEVMHRGRGFSSLTISLRQGERLCARSLVLMEAEVADLIRHGPPSPPSRPQDAVPTGHGSSPVDWWELRTVGGIDISDPDATGPPQLDVWMRFPGAGAHDDTASDTGAGGTLDRALLAYASDGFLIGTALRPHLGFGQSLAHVAFATTVLTHTLSFHEPFRAGEWLLLAQEAPYAGRGRSYGRAHVFSEDGRLVASFVQESMIRAFPDRPGAGSGRT